MPNITNIPAPRVEFIDPRTGLMSREWYRFFLNLFTLTGGGTSATTITDLMVGPPPAQDLSPVLQQINDLTTQPAANTPSGEVNKQLDALASSPDPNAILAQIAQLEKEINGLKMQVQPQLGTMAALQQANLPWATFDTTPQGVPTDVGTVAWDGGTTLGIQATSNVLMRVGEAEFTYVKASAAITKGQLCYHTGSVGSSGVITVAPTPLALADPNQIVGVAAENIALNGFGLIQISGDLRGFNTTGSSVGEVWADGDPLYYNPAYVGSFTKVKPTAPNQKTYIGEVINAGSGGSGSINIRIVPGSVLGGTDSNVQITGVTNGDILQYVAANSRWENVASSTAGVTSFSAGTTGLTPNSPTTGAVVLGGTLDVDNGGTGQTTYTDGQLLIGNSTGNTLTKSTLTAGTGITITNGAGSISIATTLSAPVTKTADFTVAAGETWIINNKSGSTCTVTLPAASGSTGRVLTFQNYQAQLLVSASSNVVPLGGGSAGTAILDAVAGNWATMVSDGTNWVVMQDAPNNALLIE